MSSRAGWVAGAMVLGAIALVVLVRQAPPADSAATTPTLPEPAAVPEAPATGVDVVEEGAAPEPPSREPAPAPTPTLVVANEASASGPPIVAKFAAEAIDPDWAPRAQTDVVSRFAEQPGLRLFTLQVECRTTLCQVQITQPSSPSGESPVRFLNAGGMQVLSIMARGDQPSMQSWVAYVLRPSVPVPDMRLLDPVDPPEQ